MEDTAIQNAFNWIAGVLKDQNIPFQIMGGLAAKCYGSERPLFDIDLDIPENEFNRLLPFVRDDLISGPSRFQDGAFDILMMTLRYNGVRIDVSGRGTGKLYNTSAEKWEKIDINLNDSNEIEIYGITVPVVKKDALITYKKKIGRPEDIEDIKAMI